MIVDPLRSGFPRSGFDPSGGIPGVLPPGAVPPGARFDPFGPVGQGRPGWEVHSQHILNGTVSVSKKKKKRTLLTWDEIKQAAGDLVISAGPVFLLSVFQARSRPHASTWVWRHVHVAPAMFPPRASSLQSLVGLSLMVSYHLKKKWLFLAFFHFITTTGSIVLINWRYCVQHNVEFTLEMFS